MMLPKWLHVVAVIFTVVVATQLILAASSAPASGPTASQPTASAPTGTRPAASAPAASTAAASRPDSRPASMPAASKPAASQAASAPAKAKFVNTVCPIMGGRIDPAKVPDSLTRQYKGQRVAFCCAACPAAWDKLTDAQKDAKLKAVSRSK